MNKALRAHWTSKRGKVVPKSQFRTLEDTLAFMDARSINKDAFHPYICPECGLWHIGHAKK